MGAFRVVSECLSITQSELSNALIGVSNNNEDGAAVWVLLLKTKSCEFDVTMMTFCLVFTSDSSR